MEKIVSKANPITPSANLLVPYYIMMSYRYYVKDDPLVSDHLFDKTAKTLLEHWNIVTHFHKDYLSEDVLRAGTYLGEYPTRATTACYVYSNKVFERRLKNLLSSL